MRSARQPAPHFGFLGLFPCGAKEVESLPSDVENCVVCLRQINQSVMLLARGRKIIVFVALAISRSMILHARASKIIFSFLGGISNHDFPSQGKHDHRFCVLWRAPKSIILYDRGCKIIDFDCLDEFLNP